MGVNHCELRLHFHSNQFTDISYAVYIFTFRACWLAGALDLIVQVDAVEFVQLLSGSHS